MYTEVLRRSSQFFLGKNGRYGNTLSSITLRIHPFMTPGIPELDVWDVLLPCVALRR